jgi:hypothetical protein
MAEHNQQALSEGDAGNAAQKAPPEAVKVVLMPDGGYAVAVEVPSCKCGLYSSRVTSTSSA